MSSLTQQAFFNALSDKFTPDELCELLELQTADIIFAFRDTILANQSMLEDELKYGH